VTETTPFAHAHEASLETSLDFINTLGLSGVAWREVLPTPAIAADWLAGHGIAHAEAALASLERPGGVERLRAVRSALREIGEASVHHRPADPAAVTELNRTLRARSYLEIAPSDDGVVLGHRHVGDALDDALATLIEPVVREIAAGRRERLRVCANDACRWVFFDDSRTGRRRWCDMATCGNRAKAARHRARAKALEGAAVRS
jgi:predicted RNA-binding Zn ribbon-like protein